MIKKVERILSAFISPYVSPILKQVYPEGQQPYYPDSEQTYTDLSQLDSEHSENTFQERNRLVYPDQWENPSWADGNFLSPYSDSFVQDMNQTPNEYTTLYDPLKGASMIQDLGHKEGSAVDSFLSPNKEIIKLSSLDLTEFMKVSDDTLIHKSKKDLWKMLKDKEGNVYIQRLFDEDVLPE